MSGFNQGFILGNVLADQRNRKFINELNDAKNTIAKQYHKMSLFKESLMTAGLVYSSTIANEFNKSSIAILDNDTDVNKRYLYIYRTKKSFAGWVNLKYDDKAGKFIFTNRKGKYSDLETNEKHSLDLKPDLSVGYNEHYKYDEKKFPIRCILWATYRHDTFGTDYSKDKYGKTRKVIDGPNILKMLNDGDLYPENIIYINSI